MSLDIKNLYFLVESGQMLDLAKRIADNFQAVHEANLAYVRGVGGVAFQASSWDGRVYAVKFEGEAPAGFKKPNKRGCCEPKKGSKYAADMAELPVHMDVSREISRLLNVPTDLHYSQKGKWSGVTSLGHPFFPCGILWFKLDGPYCIYIPDVQHYVREKEETGSTVDEPAKSFKPEFEGLRQILKEEWDLMKARHKADQEKQAA